MLPFLKKKDGGIAGIIIKSRSPDKPEENQEDSENHGQRLIDAVNSGNAEQVTECLKAAFKAFDAEPHVEGKHIEKHSYDAQNQKAGEQE